MSSKLQWYIKPGTKGAVQTLLIPSTNTNGTTTWNKVSDKDEVYRLLIERNTKKLSMSKESPFATGPIADAISPYGDDAIVDLILNGTITHESL